MQMTTDGLRAILDAHALWLERGGGQGKRADLSGADLAGANLRGADLRGADLAGANLRGADLAGADLFKADLAGADLSEADLRKADLAGANLRGANLRKADLREADLAGADLAGAYLGGSIGAVELGTPDGWVAVAWQYRGGVWLRVGCRIMSLDDGRAYWAGKPDRREVMAALDYAVAVARLRGWIGGESE